MKQATKNIVFSLIVIVMFFVIVEGVSRVFVLPSSYDFIERAIIQQGLKAKKKPQEFRILFYGGSTMHGSQLYPKSRIDIWLKLYLENLLGKEAAGRLQMANFGRLGACSDFIFRAFSNTLVYKPDLVVFYIAHNDFTILDNREKISKGTLWNRWGDFLRENFLKKSRLISFMKRLGVLRKIKSHERRDKQSSPGLWYDENVRQHYKEGMTLLDPLSRDYQIVKEQWQDNVDRIITEAQAHKIPVIFFMGVSRWQDFPPFKPFHKKDLSSQDLASWESLDRKGEDAFRSNDYPSAVSFFEKALELDPQYAMTYYRLGQCYESLHRMDLARKNYRLSDDWDYFPVRGPGSENAFLQELRQRNLPGVYFIDTPKAFEAHSPTGIPDGRLIVDQLHPTMEGQAIMALEIAKIIYEEKLFASDQPWDWQHVASWEELTQGLNLDEDFVFNSYIFGAEYVGSYYGEAIKLLQPALELRPKSLRARSFLAWAYWQNQDKDKAKELYLQLNQETPESGAEFFSRQPEIRSYVFPSNE